MEGGREARSVIGKLMGFDESPPCEQRVSQDVSRQQRVLSEGYLRKSGSIGKRLRKDSTNSGLGSKKRANLKTNKDGLRKDFEHESGKSPYVENGKLDKKMVGLRPDLGNVRDGSGPSFLHDSQTVFGWEAKKQLLERCKVSKVSRRVQPDFVNSIGVERKEGLKCEGVVKLPSFKGLNTKSVKRSRSDVAVNTKKKLLVSNLSTRVAVSSDVEPETKDVECLHGDTKDGSNCNMEEECYSCLSDLSSEQDSPIRSDEDGSVSSNSVSTDEHSDCKVETYQHSPNSVLETPFREDNSSSSECCGSAKMDLNGLWMQLHLLQSESEENDNVNNPEMVTSSDDERSTCTDQNTISTIPSGTKESRDFSYLVDVLNESGFQDSNVEIQFERWHSSECMAGPSVFETLEKKYGKQELWHRAERKLLFDHMNSGMAEIVRPRVDLMVCPKPLRRKMRSMLRRDVVEEELLALLVGQEKGVNDEVSKKAVGRGLWLDPVDEVDSIVKEIEIFLFDELVGELVSA